MAKGVIYILTNPSFPEYVKIGFATDLNERIRQLNSSAAVPYSFHAFASYDVSEKLTDCRLHALIDKLDPELRSIEKFDGKTRKREFYKMSAEDAYDLLECIATISGTTKRLHRVQANEQRQAEEKEAREDRDSARRGPFKFSDCGIRPGARVYFKKDTLRFAVVVDDRHVRYGEEVTSLSALAKEWLKLSTAVQGPRYFTYKGELLDDLRNRLSK